MSDLDVSLRLRMRYEADGARKAVADLGQITTQAQKLGGLRADHLARDLREAGGAAQGAGRALADTATQAAKLGGVGVGKLEEGLRRVEAPARDAARRVKDLGRVAYQKVSASYLDTDKGTLEREEKSGGRGKAGDALPHPAISKDAAKAQADAAAQQWGQFEGHGLFTKIGDPLAVSGAPVACTGFGTPIDETKWEAIVVTHDVIPDVGWHTTVETEVMTG